MGRLIHFIGPGGVLPNSYCPECDTCRGMLGAVTDPEYLSWNVICPSSDNLRPLAVCSKEQHGYWLERVLRARRREHRENRKKWIALVAKRAAVAAKRAVTEQVHTSG